MFKKALLIIVPIIIVIGLIFGYGIISYNSKYTVFQADGHIIAKNSKATTEKMFFDDSTKYKTVGDEVYIESKDNKTTVIPTETFIHYNDGSISTFAKSVVLDLNEMNKENYKYYNVFSETIFVKDGSNYSVNYLDKKLIFNNFLLKINDQKFMIVGSSLKLKIGGVEKTFDNNYLEITYLEGNLIKVENQGVTYQSVGDDISVEIGDKVVVDFAGKNVYKDNDRKLSLSEITVNSDDNIQINAEDNKSITGEPTNPETKGNNGSNGSNGNKKGTKKYTKEELPSMSSGVIDTDSDVEEIIETNARIKDAEFKIINFDVTANRIRAEVQIVDTDSVLQGDINIKIIESSTNKVVYETTDDTGSSIISIENDVLIPETNYILAINSDYRKNDVIYNKDFIQKTFVTDAVGVSLEKYFVSTRELEVVLKKSSYSDVASVNVNLEDNAGNTLKTVNVVLDREENIVSFDELKNDTNYKVRVYDFVYNDSIISDNFTILKSFETLKKKPVIGDLSFTIDKKEGKFNMQMNNVIDSDGGIISYKYEVYDSRTVSEEGALPITVIEKNNNASASVKVDGKNLVRGVPYVFRVVVTFNDNEKEYDYVTEFNEEVMKLDGVVFPTVKFNKGTVTFERIAGEIEIIDEGNAIDINGGSIITISYTDSVGNTNTFTSSGTLKIPFDINNLRSNETYSFAVTAPIDLQDDNPVVDNCYIGSVTIKTEDPNPFKMSFNGIEDPSYAFAIDAQITRGNSGNTELEANTLTGFNVKLYSGRNTTGTLVKTVKLVDKDLEPYSSELRTLYYDRQFRLDPAFFDMRNSDFKSEYYTIEVTNAYDYTKFMNSLPIENNVITVKIENALPDMPADPEDAVEVLAIRNADMALEQQREDLNDSTVVGYKFRAIYNNEAKYAQKITYKIHDSDGTVIDTITYNVPNTGVIDYSEVYIGDGIASNSSDGSLRRGQPFYITYEIDLDTNYDGNKDITYPLSGVLKSVMIAPKRQKPSILLYPSSADGTGYTWKYIYKDVDHALSGSKLTAYLDGSSIGDKELTLTDTYKTIKYDINKAGLFSIIANYNLLNTSALEQNKLTSQYYEGINTLNFGKVAIYPERNRVIFSFLDYDNKIDLFKRISNIKIDFVTPNKTITVDGLTTKSGNLTINYSELSELMGKTITPVITAYYDSGAYGFDTSGDYFALQQIRSTNSDPYYYYYFADNKVNTADSAGLSFIKHTFDPTRKKLTINDKIFNYSNTYDVTNTAYGINFMGSYISPKKLVTTNFAVQGDESFSFDKIIPGVSILDENNLTSIEALINSVSFKIVAFGVENQLQDDKVYVELYKVLDESASDVTLVDTYNYSLSQLNSKLTINNLLPQQDYYLKIFAYVKKDNNTYEKTYLYDVNQQRDGVNYYFKTIGSVGISNITIKYSPASYANRRINVSYDLSQTIGFSYIKYRVYRVIDENEKILLDKVVTSNDQVFKNRMSHYIKIPNDSGFVTGGKYLIEIQPVLETTIDGEQVDYELDSYSKEFSFNTLYRPYFYISAKPSGGGIKYIVNVRDYHKAIVDGQFRIQILEDTVDVTPSAYVDRDYSINNYNQEFILPTARSEAKYTFNILYNADFSNNVNTISSYIYSYLTRVKIGNEVELGTIYADTDMSDNTKINLRFFDSNRLTDIKKIRYSIYDSNDFSIDNQAVFTPRLVTNPTTYYEFQLPDIISIDGVYYISMQFLDSNGNILAEDTVEYRLL